MQIMARCFGSSPRGLLYRLIECPHDLAAGFPRGPGEGQCRRERGTKRSREKGEGGRVGEKKERKRGHATEHVSDKLTVTSLGFYWSHRPTLV